MRRTETIRCHSRERRSCAFTLVELLIVIGIIALLIAIILPAIAAAKEAASRTVCTSRLRELAQASQLYLLAYKQYPPSPRVAAIDGPVPSAMTLDTLNQHKQSLGVPAFAGPTIRELHKTFVCPFRARLDLFEEAQPGYGTDFWATGYSYIGPAREDRSSMLSARNVDRLTDARGTKRGVLWCDTMLEASTGGTTQGMTFYHTKGSTDFNPAFGTIRNLKACRGQQFGWSDGSVTSVRGEEAVTQPVGLRISIPGAFDLVYRF